MVFSLTFSELKNKTGIETNVSDNTIHRYAQFGLIERKELENGKYLYSDRSVLQLKVLLRLRSYSIIIKEMLLLFRGYSLKTLEEKIGTIPPVELEEMIKSLKVKANMTKI